MKLKLKHLQTVLELFHTQLIDLHIMQMSGIAIQTNHMNVNCYIVIVSYLIAKIVLTHNVSYLSYQKKKKKKLYG